jgi:hypothetical protein
MDWAQMRHRCPSAVFVSIACLAGYRFSIARHSRLRDCGTANIFADPDSEVWGVLYDVRAEDLVLLDDYEDGYRRETVRLAVAQNGQGPVEAVTYIAPREVTVPLPNRRYKQHLLDGARHWRLPQDYCRMLEALEAAAP